MMTTAMVTATTTHTDTPMTTSRTTRQRTAVASALSDSNEFRSAQQIHSALAQRGESVGLTTVYRAVQAMSDAGELDVITREDGEQAYRRCGTAHHHHHLVCRTCGSTVEVDAPEVEAWAESIARTNGYDDVSHTLEIFGTCQRCHGQRM